MLLKRKFLGIALAMGAIAISGCSSMGGDGHGHAHWSYDGNTSAAHWGDLKPEYATCKIGKMQSPINIAGAAPAKLPAIYFHYKNSPLKIVDNGHSIQANYAAGSYIKVAGKKYDLLQFHFHQPSEERIDGKQYPMDVHLVHKSADGKLAVVGVQLKEGKENAFLKTIWKNIPHEQGHEVTVKDVSINLAQLLPMKKNYYSFMGSLTTPPCTEGVKWMVLTTPVELSKGQISAFGNYYNHNARPEQPRNGRLLQVSK